MAVSAILPPNVQIGAEPRKMKDFSSIVLWTSFEI
jgi:hypothetical protein